MRSIPMILPRRSYRHKNVAREGCVRFRVEVMAGVGIMIGLSAEAFWVDWGDGKADSDLIHTYEATGGYDVVVSGVAINQLNLAHCWLKSIDLSECPWLEYIDVSFNFMTKLDVSYCPYLSVLLCGHGLILQLRLGNSLPWLVYLDCAWNRLELLDFPRNCGLLYLQADGNQLVCLHFQNCPDLRCVDIADNTLQPHALQKALDSLPDVSSGECAYVMYELNPSFWKVNDEQLRKRGWRCDGVEGE